MEYLIIDQYSEVTRELQSMDEKIEPVELSANHHALLFAWICKGVINAVGYNSGEEIIKKAVVRYANQRGRRMAMRATSADLELSMLNFLAYGEWEAHDDDVSQEIVERSPNCRVLVSKCPWFSAWTENELLQFGKIYCKYVDDALLLGFNRQLKLDVIKTLSNDDQPCEFIFYAANLDEKNMQLLEARRAKRHENNAIMPWSYHLAHLYSTVESVLNEELGVKGKNVIEAAINTFTNEFGEQAASLILEKLELNFDQVL